MPSTTNFGWTTPADTDLVKDGASAIRTLGNGIDTSLVDLKGGTTGQVLAKASNTDLDFTWSAADPLSILDAKGDLISATAADTPARLASSGVNGEVLTVDTSTSTGLKWAAVATGSMTSIASGSLSSSTVTISSIVSTYRDLKLVLEDVDASTSGNDLRIRINGDSTSNYRTVVMRAAVSTLSTTTGQDAFSVTGQQENLPSAATSNCYIVDFPEYARTSFHPITATWATSGGAAGFTFGLQTAITAAIDSITIFTSAGATFDAGTYTLYGVK